MGGEIGVKAVVYNTPKGKKKGDETRNKREKRLKKYNSKKEEFFTIDHIVRARLRMLLACENVQLFPLNAIYQYLYLRFRLVFSPTLYKFIVWAFWAWVHSCSGFKSKLVLTILTIHFPTNCSKMTLPYYHSRKNLI